MGFGLRCAAILLGVGLCACGTKTSTSPPQTGTGGTGGPSGGGELPAQCAAFADELGGPSPRMVIRNATSRVIHLGPVRAACGSFVPYSIATEGGQVLSIDQDCPTLCSARMKGLPFGCPLICVYPRSITLQPGESTLTKWGGYFASTLLPRECRRDSPSTEQCTQFKKIEPGTYLFSAQAGTELDCSSTTSNPECEPCEPVEAGGCATNGGVIAGDVLRAETTIEVDASHGVGADASSDPTPVELVFTP